MNKILEVLKEKGKNQKWLADNSDVSKQGVSKMCRNIIQPRLETLFHIADILKVKPARLLGDGSEITEDEK
jgi:putative transcriptional regulator